MFEESVSTIPSLWASMNSWFTPTVLFVLLNVMIGTIAFTSTLANQNRHHQQEDQRSDPQPKQQQQQQPQLGRSPSVLQRLRSIKLYGSYQEEEPPKQPPTPPDSDILFNFNQTDHHIQTQSAYIFQENLQEKSYIYQENPQATPYIFQENHGDNPNLYSAFHHPHLAQNRDLDTDTHTHTHLGFDPQTQYVIQGNIQENQYIFQGDHQENLDNSIFQQTHEEKVSDLDTHLESEKIHEEKMEENEGEEDGDDVVNGLDEMYSKVSGGHVNRSMSDTKPASGEVPEKLAARMRKSASMKSAFNHFEAADVVEARRPATVKEKGNAKMTDGDHEVDAKADDFINRFKEQLKLQRLDSIIRYKEVIARGSGR